MGKFPKPLNTPKGGSEPREVDPVTPEEGFSPESLNLESAYLSICCLLQTESAASYSLVTEYDMIAKIIDKLAMGVPRDIEELSLSAISSSLSWLPLPVFERCTTNGLIELCHQIVVRFVTRRDMKTLDKSCEVALSILSDVSRLDDRVCKWGLDHMEYFVKIATECPTSYPSIVVKRSVLRLIYTLVSESEIDTSNWLTTEFWALLTSSSDLEVRCFVLMTAIFLNKPNECEFDVSLHLNEVILEASTFTCALTDEEELRLSNWRSKIRALGTFLTFLSDSVIDDSFEDSVENRVFATVPSLDLPHYLTVPNLNFLVEALAGICDKVNTQEPSAGENDEKGLVLEDADLRNVFDTTAQFVSLCGLRCFRIEDGMTNAIIPVISRICEITMKLDLHMYSSLFEKISAVLWLFLLSVLSGKNTAAGVGLSQIVQWLGVVLANYWTDDENETTVELTNVFDSIQMIFTIDANSRSICAQTIVTTLGSLQESKVSDESICSLSECIFVIFSESDFDAILNSVEWVHTVQGFAKVLKTRNNKLSEYMSATVSNIKAFVSYKKK